MSRFRRETSVAIVEVFNSHDNDKRYQDRLQASIDFGDGPYHLDSGDIIELIGALEEALKVLQNV